jgi:hypothetical protein
MKEGGEDRERKGEGGRGEEGRTRREGRERRGEESKTIAEP